MEEVNKTNLNTNMCFLLWLYFDYFLFLFVLICDYCRVWAEVLMDLDENVRLLSSFAFNKSLNCSKMFPKNPFHTLCLVLRNDFPHLYFKDLLPTDSDLLNSRTTMYIVKNGRSALDFFKNVINCCFKITLLYLSISASKLG